MSTTLPVLPVLPLPTLNAKININNNNNENIVETPPIITISKDAIKRLLKDIQQIIKSPLHDQGIYYKHSETNILEGCTTYRSSRFSLLQRLLFF